MGRDRRIVQIYVVRALAVMALATLATACSKKPEDTEAPTVGAIPQPRPLSDKKPLDHVEQGALIEGTDKVFALPLPYGFRINSRTATSTVTYGDAPPRQVATYVQTRVRDGSLVEKNGNYIFSGVRLPSEPDRILNIEIDSVRNIGAQMLVTDKTPPADLGAANPLPVDRLKQVGLDSHGRVIDPAHLE